MSSKAGSGHLPASLTRKSDLTANSAYTPSSSLHRAIRAAASAAIGHPPTRMPASSTRAPLCTTSAPREPVRSRTTSTPAGGRPVANASVAPRSCTAWQAVHEGGGGLLVLAQRRPVDVEEDGAEGGPAPLVEPAAGLKTPTEMQHAWVKRLPAPARPIRGRGRPHGALGRLGASHSPEHNCNGSRALSSATEIVSNVTGARGEQVLSSLSFHALPVGAERLGDLVELLRS